VAKLDPKEFMEDFIRSVEIRTSLAKVTMDKLDIRLREYASRME
jgi:hypothetical protein